MHPKSIEGTILLIIVFFISSTKIYAAARPVMSKNGMVVSACEIASDVGIEILKKGGNAVDAAVAVGFALAVTYPYAGNIGGGGFMVIHFSSGTNTTIDYREKAPLKSSRDMYIDENGKYNSELSKNGVTSVAVPGSVAGLIHANNKYGKLSLHDVIQPAIDLAENGWMLDFYSAKSFENSLNEFSKYPSSMKIFSKKGNPYKEGDLFVQKNLAWTLNQIKNFGFDGFYKGKVADLLVKQIENLGGYISREDLEKYEVKEREPVKGSYRDYEIISMGTPSSGGIALIEMLNILENFDFEKTEWGSSGYVNKLTETMKYVYADRTYHLGDSDFYPVPVSTLISKKYAKSIFDKLKPFAVPSENIKSQIPEKLNESMETTHYSVYDKYGNAVSVTTTINSGFGSKIVVDGAGFLLNNEMDDFSAKPGEPNQFGLLGSIANSIEPEKRMLSSMTPTIILKDDKPYIILGSPGGSTIITAVLQVILNRIEFNMNIQEAVNAPRIHHQWYPDSLYIEKFAVTDDTSENLRKMGYALADRDKTFRVLGSTQAILIDADNDVIYGAADPRRNSSAKGY